ncbi:MAG: S49 family peptidase [Lentilitoribacter sp.]
MPRFNLERLAGRMFGRPLFAHPEKAIVVADVLMQRMSGLPITQIHSAMLDNEQPVVNAGILTDRTLNYYKPNSKLFDTVNGIAVINVEGSLVAKGDWIGAWSGMTSYEGLSLQIDQALKDPAIKGVVLETDSYGGEVDGCFECVDRIRHLAERKPVMSILTSHACSAGYALASAANQIVVPETGIAGSMGVITIHTEISKANEMAGVSVTVLRAGDNKADFNPFEALGEDVANNVLKELSELRELFCQRVADNRGSRLTYDQAMATEAKTYRGPHAVKEGICDAVADPKIAFDEFVNEYGSTEA